MPKASSILLIVVLASGLHRLGVNGTITNPPMNTAAEVGGQIIFDCTSDASSPNWVFSTNREEFEAPSGQNIVIGCIVQPAFATHYDVDRIGGSSNKCNLIVKAITMQQAGVYTCTDITSRLSSVLTVIDRNASIAVSSQPQTVEGETVRMYYTVTYNSSIASSITPTIKPVLSWTDSDGNIVTSSPASTANSVSSSISVTAGRQDIRPYTCHISYTSPSTKPSFATNSPSSVSNSPSTSTINVLYAPIISSITMNQDVPVCPGKTVEITCHATANPAPNYSWIGPDSRTYSGETIEAAMNGVYNCTASNNIRGSAHSDTNYATLNVSWNASVEKCTQENEKPTESRMVFIICVVIGAYILGNIIATIVFLVCYNRNIDLKRNLNDRFTWLRNMLPCMNENVTCGCGWIFLSVCVFTLIGILFIIAICCCSQGRKRSEANVKHFHNPRDIIETSDNPGPDGVDHYEQIDTGNISSPSSRPPNPHNDTLQNQQPTNAQGPVYSVLPVTNLNIQPQQYIEGNNDASNYSELKTT